MNENKKIYPCLWFNANLITVADYYAGIFKDAEVISKNELTVHINLNGQRFMLLNGGPLYQFSPATSFVIECKNQAEVDYYWEKLGAGGKYNKCGWLDDKFGVSWQIVPEILGELMSDPKRAPKVAAAFMDMTKFEIDKLLKA